MQGRIWYGAIYKWRHSIMYEDVSKTHNLAWHRVGGGVNFVSKLYDIIYKCSLKCAFDPTQRRTGSERRNKSAEMAKMRAPK